MARIGLRKGPATRLIHRGVVTHTAVHQGRLVPRFDRRVNVNAVAAEIAAHPASPLDVPAAPRAIEHRLPLSVAQRAPSHAMTVGAGASGDASSISAADVSLFVPPSPPSSARAGTEIVRMAARNTALPSRRHMARPLARTLPTGATMIAMKRPALACCSRASALLDRLVAHALVTCTLSLATADVARADQAPPVDVSVKEEPPPSRIVTLQWNPVDLVYERLSANLQIVPTSHHALMLTPFYFDSQTAAFTQSGTDAGGNPVNVQVPSQKFEGFGGEIGYRYFTGHSGPRGFFIGPSFIIADVQATAGSGAQTTLMDYGIAVDAGYQMLVADNWAVSLGLGAEYVFTSKSLPDQQWPANIYANSGFHPRPLFALGYAF